MAEQASNIMPFPGTVAPGREQTVRLHQRSAAALLRLIGRTEQLLGIRAENTTSRALKRQERRRQTGLTFNEITDVKRLTRSMDKLLAEVPTLPEVPEITRRLDKVLEHVIRQDQRQGMA